MASVSWFKARNTWRISYYVKLNGKLVLKAKYAKVKWDANLLKRQIERLEDATKMGIATDTEIAAWIDKGWIKQEETEQAFSGYAETANRKYRKDVHDADFEQILNAYEQYAIDTSKGGPDRKSHQNHMSMAGKAIEWLKEAGPLNKITPELITSHLNQMKREYSEWTVYHFSTKLRLLLDQAMTLGMIHENPARKVSLKQPKKAKERRILTEVEVGKILEVSLNHRHYISGSVPTVVRLGLYAGLRNEEMCWLKWNAIDWTNRIISIRESVCEIRGRVWIPKDYEARRLDVKEACISYLKDEFSRQEQAGILGPFVMPGGNKDQPDFRKRPLYQDQPQKGFVRMIEKEKMDTDITVYSLRHTYATMALRSGVDVRTLQRRMGHSDIRTTMEYLHYIEPEQHPMDNLPY